MKWKHNLFFDECDGLKIFWVSICWLILLNDSDVKRNEVLMLVQYEYVGCWGLDPLVNEVYFLAKVNDSMCINGVEDEKWPAHKLDLTKTLMRQHDVQHNIQVYVHWL